MIEDWMGDKISEADEMCSGVGKTCPGCGRNFAIVAFFVDPKRGDNQCIYAEYESDYCNVCTGVPVVPPSDYLLNDKCDMVVSIEANGSTPEAARAAATICANYFLAEDTPLTDGSGRVYESQCQSCGVKFLLGTGAEGETAIPRLCPMCDDGFILGAPSGSIFVYDELWLGHSDIMAMAHFLKINNIDANVAIRTSSAERNFLLSQYMEIFSILSRPAS
ncbi:MAG: hypothetical protein QXS54_00435 [Candidatus Methanomethylicaceae archaeon]